MTNIENITGEIQKALKAYAYEVSNEIDIAKNNVSKDLRKQLEFDSPEQTGSYKKGWRIKKFKNTNIVHNKTDYQLTHLLEHGHVNRDGGRTNAQVHIRPNEEKAVKDFVGLVQKAVKE